MLVVIDQSNLIKLKEEAKQSPRLTHRICLHDDTNHPTQEMIICAYRGCYFIPHKHPVGRSESYSVLEGQMSVHFFNEYGQVVDHIILEERGGKHPFIYRLKEPLYHFVQPCTELVIYHEIFTGPWSKNKAVIQAPFAPPEGDHIAISKFISGLEKSSCHPH